MRKFKKLFILPAVIVLCMSVMMGNLMTAFAAPVSVEDDSFTIPAHSTTYAKGDTVTFDGLDAAGVLLKVKDPIGRTVTLNDDKESFAANMAGYYTVAFEKGSVVYDKLIIKVEADSAVIKIPYNGADIPTYTGVGSDNKVEFNIPVAEMVVWDEDDANIVDEDATEKAQDYTITYQVTAPDGTLVTLGTANEDNLKKVESNKGAGTYLVRYKAANGSEVKVKDFTVNAVKDFADTEKPKLSMMTVRQSLPQNVEYTLPKATATDNYDENVKITVTVTGPDGEAVKEVTVGDDTDPNKLVIGEEAVKFDNDKVMSFYPTKEGLYQVTYTAIDDAGNKAISVYNIEPVKDTRAPVIDADSVPANINWGISVAVTLDGDDQPLYDNDPVLKIAIPTVTDNVAKVEQEKLMGDETANKPGANQVRLFYSLRDADNTVIYNSFNSGLKKGDHDTINYKSEGEGDTFDHWLELKFNKQGIYTLTFTARDTDSNGSYLNASSKVVSIDVKNEYIDTDAPVAEIENTPQYIFVGEKFTAPVINARDTYGGPDLDEPLSSSDFVKEVVYTFTPDGGVAKPFDFKTKSYFKPTESGIINIEVTVTDSVGNTDTDSAEIFVFEQGADIDFADDLELNYDWDFTVTADNKARFNNITVSAGADDNNFLGYELLVKKDGKLISTTVASHAVSNSVLTLDIAFDVEVENDKFKGKYDVTLRAFRLNGESVVAGYTIADGSDVTAKEAQTLSELMALPTADQTAERTAPIGDLEVLEGFKLPGQPNIDIDANYRVIKGISYSLHGNIFTPKYAGHTFDIALYQKTGGNFETNESGKAIKYDITGSADGKFAVLNSQSVQVGVLGEVTEYKPKWDGKTNLADLTVQQVEDNFVKIPGLDKYFNKANALDGNAALKIEVKVTDRNGATVNTIYWVDQGQVKSVDRHNLFKTEGDKYFAPTVDGRYTIEYIVDGVSHKVSDIMVGDLIMPTITNLDELTPQSSYKRGYKLELAEVVASDNVTTDSDKLTINTKLYAPNGSLMTIESEDDTDFYTLNDSGTYRLVYEVVDEAGNRYVKQFTFSVNAGVDTVNYELLSTVLIIAAVVLIIGVGVYFFRFRKIKED